MYQLSKGVNFKRLYYFFAVATTGSIAQASRNLEIAPSSISEQIKLLEGDFSVKLFNRDNRSMILTDQGRRMLRYAKAIFRTGDKLVAAFTKGETTANKLSIGLSSTFTRSLAIEQILPIFELKDLYTSVVVAPFEDLKNDLQHGELDLLFSTQALLMGAQSVSTEKVAGISLVLCTAKNSRLRSTDEFSENFPFITFPPYSPYRPAINHFLQNSNLKPKIIGETNDVSIIRSALVNDVAAAILPKASTNQNMEIVRTVPDCEINIYASFNEQQPLAEVQELIRKSKERLTSCVS